MDRRDYVFHRDFNYQYPIISHAEGVYLYDQTGKKYLDASSGAVAVNLGHGVREIIEGMAAQARRVAFAHTMRFETEVLHELAREIAEIAPHALNRVYFTCGGAEANESALKLAHQYHRDRGKATKHLVLGRWQSYHGNTLGALSAGGDIKRRQPFTPMLLPFLHVFSPHCRRCPFQQEYDTCQAKGIYPCVEQVEQTIREVGPEYISAFICEPIVGSQQGAVVPPDGYFAQVRKICDKYDILLIIDEVMTGFGRTGRYFASEHFGVEPDIITFGKGVSSGYAPLGGMIVHERIIEALIKNSEGKFMHGYTYSGHPVSVAAGLEAVKYYKEKEVLANCLRQSQYLFKRLKELAGKHHVIGEIRGKGLLIGLELVQDKAEGREFPSSYPASEKLNAIAMDLGAVFYPGSGSIDGIRGHHLLIAPPLTITQAEIDEMVQILDQALSAFTAQLDDDLRAIQN